MGIIDTNDLHIPNAESAQNIDIKMLPGMVTAQFDNIKILEDRVLAAMRSANEAKKAADNAKVDIRIFKTSKKDAIYLLQNAAQGLAESQQTIVDAQQLFFEYQKKTAEIMDFLFALGTSSIASNRATSKAITEKLKGNSGAKLSDLAKQELSKLLIQLKNQEDVFETQERMKASIREQSKRLHEQEQKQAELNENIKELEKKLEKQSQKTVEKKTTETSPKTRPERNPKPIVPLKKKSKKVAGWLAILLGYVGAHWFYLGKPVRALIYLGAYILCPFLWLLYIVEGVFFLCTKPEIFEKYRGWSTWW